MENKPYPLYQHKDLSSIRELVEHAVERFQEKTAFMYERGGDTVSITYEQLHKDILALGTAFLEHGLADRKIAILGGNSYYWILTYLAIVSIGSVAIPLDKDLQAQEIEFLLNDSDTDALVYSSAYKEKAQIILGENSNNISGLMHAWEMENDLPSLMTIGSELIADGNISYNNIRLDVNKMCTLVYTSGTTGVSKGVMLSNKNIAGNVSAQCKQLELTGRQILVLPMQHLFILTGVVLCILSQGGEIFLNSDLREISNDMMKYSPDFMIVVPAFLEMFLNKIWDAAKKNGQEEQLEQLISYSNTLIKTGTDNRNELFKSVIAAFGGKLKFLGSGGAKLDKKIVDGLNEFGLKVFDGYGITECSPLVTGNRNDYYRNGSVGLILPGYELRIDNPNEEGVGEICVKGSCVMLGYYKNEDATKTAIRDGWFYTGDLGSLDSDGFLYINGRIKNLIILSNGKNVYPEELEFNLGRITLVQETIIYADGNAIVAEIFPNAAVVAAQHIENVEAALQAEIAVLNKTLPLYKNINRVVIRDKEFEKTTSRKIKRNKTVSAIKKEEYIAPTNQVEADFAHIMAQVLDIPKVGIHDNFIDLGGDSLKAITYSVELEEAGYQIAVETIYGCPTVASLVQAYEMGKKHDSDKPVEVSFEKTDVDNQSSHFLLAGASGFLGAHILGQLLHTTDSAIYCLVRNIERLKDALSYYFGDDFLSRHSDRIKVCVGDITKPNLGLTDDEYDALLKDVGSVINASANVKHFGLWESFKAPNVDGVVNLVGFCQRGGAALHHISTTAIADAQAAQNNYYVRSKRMAEEIITSCVQKDGLKASIYRVGNLTERHSDGVFQRNEEENAFRMRLKALTEFGHISNSMSTMPLEFSPVDRCAEAITKLVLLKQYGELFHVFNHNTITFIDYAKIHDINLSVLDDEAFAEQLRVFAKQNDLARVLLTYMSEFADMDLKMQGSKDDKTLALLQETGFSW